MPQLALNIESQANQPISESFIIDGCNKQAHNFIANFPQAWAANCLLIIGEAQSGKSHLSQIWRNKAYAKLLKLNEIKGYNQKGQFEQNIIVEDICALEQPENKQYEEDLFHLYNNLKAADRYLLLTSSKPVFGLNFTLPDLKSRITSSMIANIEPLGEEFQQTLFLKKFLDCQLKVPQKVIEYIIPRVERSFASTTKIVELLNKKSIETKRNITIPFVKESLDI